MMFKPTVFATALLCAVAVSAASHWTIKDGTGAATVRDSGSFKLDGTIVQPRRCTWAREDDRGFFLTFDRGGCVKVPHDPRLSFKKGFVAEIFFSCDLSKTASTNFACLLSKGDRWNRGYSIMVRRDGALLVTLNGLSKHWYGLVEKVKIPSNKDTRLKVVYDKKNVRIYVDGKAAASYPVAGELKDEGDALHLGGIVNYPFTGNIYDVKLSEFGVDKAKAGHAMTELEKLQSFKAPKVVDPEGTVVISDFSKFSPASALTNGFVAMHTMYVIRRDAAFWGNGMSTMIYPAASPEAPDILYDPQLEGKYDVYLSVRSTGQDSLSQAVVGDRYFRIVAKGLGGKHRSYEVLLARDVEMAGKKVGLSASVGGYVGYFKLIPSAKRRQGEVPDPAGSCVEGPRMTEAGFDEWAESVAKERIASGMFRVRTFVETRRCAAPSERSRRRGFQLFERDWMDLCFPVSVPTVDTGTVKLAAAAAPGEFEPVTLCVRGVREVGDLSLACGKFTGPDGKTAQIECRIGVVENLMKRTTNYTGNSEVMKGPIYISRTNAIAKLAANETRQFWITLRAPEGARPGLYKTSLELQSSSGTGSIPLELEVYPFTLDRHGLGFTFFGFSNAVPREGLEKVVRDYAEHGMTMLPVKKAFAFKGDTPDTAAIDWERSMLPELMRLVRKYGVDEFVMLVMTDLHKEAEKYGPDFEKVLSRMLLDLKQRAAENRWPPLYLVSFDEILSNPEQIPKALDDVRIIRKVGMINLNDHIWYKTSRQYQHVCDEFAPLNDIFMNRFNTKNFWYVDTWQEMQRRCDAEGKKLMPYNSNNAVMFTQPAAARYSYGWFHRTAGKGTIGHATYTYCEPKGLPYNDLDGGCTDWLCNYPATSTRKGGPAIDWESYREGADDMRYIATLEHRIAAAEKRGIDVSAERALLEKLVASLDMKKFYAESLYITPKWTRTWSENGQHYASGVFNVPVGWEFADFHNARRALARAIMSIDRKLKK